MEENLVLMMTNTFKALFNFYQLILISSQRKFFFFQNMKIKTEKLFKAKEINIIINEMSERNYAQK